MTNLTRREKMFREAGFCSGAALVIMAVFIHDGSYIMAALCAGLSALDWFCPGKVRDPRCWSDDEQA